MPELNRFQAYLERLRYPQLFLLLAVLLVVDLAVPDVVPFVDELVLAALTTLVASLPRRGGPEKPPPKNVTPPGSRRPG